MVFLKKYIAIHSVQMEVNDQNLGQLRAVMLQILSPNNSLRREGKQNQQLNRFIHDF